MEHRWWVLLLMLVVLVVPFQFLGVLAYVQLVKSNRQRARRAVVLVPAAAFFITFLVIFLWRYFHPGLLMIGEGGINLVILILMFVGAVLHLACGTLVRFILARRGNRG